MQTQTASAPATPTRTTTEEVIAAVRGRFYSYSALFTLERPLGCLMDCKANKDRPLSFADSFADEVDLVFLFENGVVRLCSPHARPAAEALIERVLEEDLLETQFAIVDMTADAFDELRSRKNGEELGDRVLGEGTDIDNGVVTLSPGMTIAVITQTGKYGLLRVGEITPTAVAVDACHILR